MHTGGGGRPGGVEERERAAKNGRPWPALSPPLLRAPRAPRVADAPMAARKLRFTAHAPTGEVGGEGGASGIARRSPRTGTPMCRAGGGGAERTPTVRRGDTATRHLPRPAPPSLLSPGRVSPRVRPRHARAQVVRLAERAVREEGERESGAGRRGRPSPHPHPLSSFLSRCSYPQELILDLADGPARVATLQLLSHESKIAARVDLHAGTGPASARAWRRLGSLAFDPNHRSGHAARELKSVAVGAGATALRLVLHAPHANPLNPGDQVGVVAVNVVGETLEGGGGGGGVAGATLAAPLAAAPSLPSTTCSDADIAAHLAELDAAKAAAVEAEDYEGAARLKAAADALRSVATALDALADRKAAAVAAEDYDAAKRIKGEMERVKARVAGGVGGGAAARDRGGPSGDPDAPPRSAPRPPTLDAWDETPARPTRGASADVGGGGGEARALAATAAAAALAAPADLRWGDAAGVGIPPGRYHQASEDAPRPATPDDRPASAGAAPPPALDPGPPPADWPADLPPVEPLGEPDAKEVLPLVPWLGAHAAAALRARAWAPREAALARARSSLAGAGIPAEDSATDRREWARCLGRALAGALRDRVPAVAVAAAAAARAAGDAAAGGGAPREAALIVADVIPALVERAADANARVAGAAADAALALVAARGVAVPLGPFVKPLPTNAAPKIVAARLALLAALLPVVGVAGGGGGGGATASPAAAPPDGHAPHQPALDADAVMRVAGAALGSPAADVRAAAARVAAAVAARAGAGVLRLLPKGVHPKLRPQIEAAAGVEGGGGGGGGGGAPTPPPPPADAPRKPARAAAPAKGKKAAAVAVAATAAAAEAATPPPPAAADPPPSNDPAPYEAELAARESALGPAHPRTADALCALAAARAARGERAAAEALLTRALAAYEAATGPDSTDVAAALTDLGVLRLEVGDEGGGRPLLQRALAIQAAALGEAHPDAVAIRDVLEADA